MLYLPDKYKCTGCLACVETCPFNALSPVWNSEGHLTYKVDTKQCRDCKKCEKICPVQNDLCYATNNFSNSIPFAAWSLDDQLRHNSSSGGVFAAIAKSIIEHGGVAIGASVDRIEVKHVLIEDVEDIIKIQGSKYAQSNTYGIYNIVKKHLSNGRAVLFSGLPCQVAGLISYLPESISKEKLLTIDLICGGIPSRFLITKFFEQTDFNGCSLNSFRKKSIYEFSIKGPDGSQRIIPKAQRPLPLCGFYNELTNKYACYDCPYSGANRLSDITIGDYWGDTAFPEQHEKGISVAVAHSTKGLNALNNSNLETHKIDWKVFLMNNPRMVYGKNKLYRTRERRNLERAFSTYSYMQLLVTYAGYSSWKTPFSFIIKLKRIIIYKIHRIEMLFTVKKILKQNSQ